jgi:hypothetical protein
VVTGGPYINEDINANLLLDTGEDGPPYIDPGHGDGELTPPNSAAGSVPGTVETDEYGVGNFELVYLKSSAVWIDDEITASTIVLGTETTSTLVFSLPYLVSDAIYLPDSPYGLGSLTIEASAGAGGTIAPAGPVSVPVGTDLTFTIAVTTGLGVEDVLVDGESVGVVFTYTFVDVRENHTISVTFEPVPEPPEP